MTGGRMKTGWWRFRGAIGALSLLVIGFLAGMVADRFVIAHHRPAHDGPVGTHEAAIEAFRSVLDLSDDQMQQIHEVLLRHQVRVDDAWRGLRGEIREGVESAHREIQGLLTAEQRARFDEWMERHLPPGTAGDTAVLWAH